MNIEEFKGSFDQMARTNRFRVSGFGLPADTEFMVKAATIPSTTINPIDIPYSGRKIKIAGDPNYESWVFTAYNPTHFGLYDAVTDWKNSINSPVENVGVNPAGYKRDGIIEVLDNQNNVLKTIQIVGGWPSVIGEITLDWEAEDEIQTFEVTLEYDYHL